MALLVCRGSQKFVPLISCAITFDQNYIFTRKFFKIVFALLSACIRKFNVKHPAVCFLSHSVAVAALIRISHLACRERDFLLALSEPSFQILHGVRSWVFIDHRRTGNFLPGGALNHLPKKFSQVAQIFTKQ